MQWKPNRRDTAVRFPSAVRQAGLVVAVTALALTAGCAKKDDSEVQASGVKLVKAGKLTVCTHLPYAPFQSNDRAARSSASTSTSIDLVAKKLGVKQAIVDTPFEGIKSGAGPQHRQVRRRPPPA